MQEGVALGDVGVAVCVQHRGDLFGLGSGIAVEIPLHGGQELGLLGFQPGQLLFHHRHPLTECGEIILPQLQEIVEAGFLPLYGLLLPPDGRQLLLVSLLAHAGDCSALGGGELIQDLLQVAKNAGLH